MVRIIYTPTKAFIETPIPPDVDEALEKELCYVVSGTDTARAMFYASGGQRNQMFRHWDGFHRLYKKDDRGFPTGLIDKVITFLKTHGLQVELAPYQGVDLTRFIPNLDAWFVPTLRDDQQYLTAALLGVARGVVQAPTGSGKTVMIAELTQRYPRLKILVCVPSKGLLHQTHKELQIFTGEQVGIWGDSKYEDGRIVVSTIQTACSKLPDMKRRKHVPKLDERQALGINRLKEFEYVIYDEAHMVASESHRILAYWLPNAWIRHGLSATLKREDDCDMMVEGIIGPKQAEVEVDELIGKIDPRTGNPVLSELRIEMHEFRHPQLVFDWKETQENILKDVARTDFGVSLVRKALFDDGLENVVVLFRFDEHGQQILERIKALLPNVSVELIQGKTTTVQRDKAVARFVSGETKILVASTILDVGINIPEIQGLVIMNAEKGSAVLKQRVGRAMRYSARIAIKRIYDISDDNNPHLESQARARYLTYIMTYGLHRVTTVKNGVVQRAL